MARRLGAIVVLAVVVVGLGIALAESSRGPAARHKARSLGASKPPAAVTSGSVANLAPGSDPSVLPGPVLIADSDNNRLIEVSPTGHVVWEFPRPGDLAPGQTFRTPDDAFYASNARQVIATQEEDFTISVIDLARDRIVYRYGHPGVPGSAPDYLDNPDDALLMPGGQIRVADIKNCRLLVIQPPAHQIVRQLGQTGVCAHQPSVSFGSPNGWFPMHDGNAVVSEINGDWIDVMSPAGQILTSTNAPGFTYPSDTNEVRPGVLISADYANPGAIETFTPSGQLLWRYAPSGPQALNSPSLAETLPNGDVLANDDHNNRVIVIDPHTNRIVWQYGHTHVAGRRPGYLADPDGVDLAPPYSLLGRFK
jgi:DNA-binding beta-propeller fold protein YncE